MQYVQGATLRRWSLRLLISLVVISTAIIVFSVTTTLARTILLTTLLVGVLTGGMYLRQLCVMSSIARTMTQFVGVLLLLWLSMGYQPPNAERLRATYLTRLLSYNHARFIWGGETHFGVDCSGLARTALFDAMLQEGVREGNPRLLGPMLWRFWWRDLSANAIGDGAHGYTYPVKHVERLAGADTTGLKIGDLAVVAGGQHVLIYVGDNRWIEANPADGRVVVNEATPDSMRGYFNMPATILRWWVLEDAGCVNNLERTNVMKFCHREISNWCGVAILPIVHNG